MPDFHLVRCPYCKYIWCRRGELKPISCPRCKKRFDRPGNRVRPEETENSCDDYSLMREWLADANRFSMQCKSLEEVAEKVDELL